MIKAAKHVFSLIGSFMMNIGKYILKTLRFITYYVLILLIILFGFHWYFLLIPVVVYLITSILMVYLNTKNKGDRIPIPTERFTQDMGDGEITIENSRLQELILYVFDIEQYLLHNGYTDR